MNASLPHYWEKLSNFFSSLGVILLIVLAATAAALVIIAICYVFRELAEAIDAQVYPIDFF